MIWILFAILTIFGYFWVPKFSKRIALLNKLKDVGGPPGVPILGNALELSADRKGVLKVLEGYINSYGRRFVFRLGIQPYACLSNALDVEKVLSSQSQIEKSSDYDSLHAWLGLGLLTSKGEQWFHRRKQLTPAFHFKILDDFLRVFNEQCDVLLQVLLRKDNQTFNIFPVITNCALDIICESAMGRRINAQERSDSDYVKAIYRLSELIQYRQLRPWLALDIIWQLSPAGREETECLRIVHGFTDSVIRERKKEILEVTNTKKTDVSLIKNSHEDIMYMNAPKKRLAFLDLLLEAQESDKALTDKNIREETDTFMFEGHDTTSAGASWTTFLLSCHPEHQRKVQNELDEIFGDDRTREVTMADLAKMKYLECCIKEGLRLYPSVPLMARKTTHDQELSDGTVIPTGCILFILTYFLHRDPKTFPDPEKFDPERFLPENSNGRHPFAYIPFSAGPRNCIGQKFAMMEEKVIVSSIFRNFQVIAMENREDVNVLCELITRPECGLHVSLQRR